MVLSIINNQSFFTRTSRALSLHIELLGMKEEYSFFCGFFFFFFFFFFAYFSRKMGFDFSNPFGKNKKKILLICCLLKLPIA